MKFYILAVLLLVRTSCIAQRVPEKLLYELSEAIAGEHFMLSDSFRPSIEKRELVPGIDRIEFMPDTTKDTSVVRLLDHNPDVIEYTQAKAWISTYTTSSKRENVLLSHFSQA